MLKNLFAPEAKPGAFFRRIDWTAFWSAALISFLVYFFTLGPSVGLEDSGELATAADHLGVPHPPGYPFWTMCGWVFCRAFAWVTYMGHPTPAWALSLFSAVTGAFAAGCTAMLICRSGSDMLDSMDSDGGRDKRDPPADTARHHALMGFAGGLGGSLVFAFSPVEWSQSTIVEIYSLNALFLMAVFLLSYRWMRKPSDKILWLTAFVFGLGLTNYQVLLMAALPLAVIILFKDIRLFRDCALILIPVGLTAQVLKIGSRTRASAEMTVDAINKLEPELTVDNCPNETVLWIAFALVVAAPVVGKVLAVLTRRRNAALCGALATGLSGIALIALAATVFAGSSPCTWTDPEFAPRIHPAKYAWIALFLAATCVLSLGAVFAPADASVSRFRVWSWLAGAGVCATAAGCLALLVPQAGDAGYQGKAFNWAVPVAVLAVGLVLLVTLALLTPRQRGLAFALPVASVQIVVFILLYKGAMNGLTHPTTWWFFWPCIWNFVVFGLATAALPNGRTIGPAMLFAELGVSFYAYMPIVSSYNPPMNWGYPSTWDGFKYAITRGQYDSITIPYLYRPRGLDKFIGQMTLYFQDLRTQFTTFTAALAFVPFALWSLAVRMKRNGWPVALKVNAVFCSSFLYVLVVALGIASAKLLANPSDGTVTLELDNWPMIGMALFAAVGVYLLIRRQVQRIFSLLLPWPGFRKVIALTLLGLSAGVMTWMFFCCLAGRGFAGGIGLLSLGIATAEQIKEGIAVVPKPGSVSLFMGLCAGTVLLAVAEIVRLARGRRKPIMCIRALLDDVSQQWLIAVGLCFAIMSFFLVALADVSGDILDGFIQKVKFISSHGMLSLWIGYGLIAGLVVANRLVARFISNIRARRVLFGILCVGAVCMAGIPVYENYTNDKLVFALGSAEQNGHTFGWQFGNYQLRGANAIREELAPDEEPLPNPLWPEEMGPSAILFGGTDPGRFVPTYMIYSAQVRPDVYLVTQNALSDENYMSAMRDLYGDEIWIPSTGDSAAALSEYVNNIPPDERAAKGVIDENGFIHVTDTLSVIELNGILLKKMFDHERGRRDFYIEECYIVQWMYPNLTPHGLILKINGEANSLNETIILNDMEFWDWYTRRLLKDPAFRRDFAAQTCFSKLRTTLAGFYAHARNRSHGLTAAKAYHDLAATAFQEAIALCPASQEATLRYTQELLALTDKWDAIIDIAEYQNRVDPENGFLRMYRENALRARNATSARDYDEARKFFHNMSQSGYTASSNQPLMQRLANGKDPL